MNTLSYYVTSCFRLLRKIIATIRLKNNCVCKNVLISSGLFVSRGKDISVSGVNVYLGRNCHVGTNLYIGSHVMVASNVSFVGGDHDISDPDELMMFSGRANQVGVTLDDNVWIGHGAILLDGVKVHEGSVIAAGSVVTKTFPPFSIIGGNPAKIIRRRK